MTAWIGRAGSNLFAFAVAVASAQLAPGAMAAGAYEKPSAMQVMDACMKVEIPAALKKLGLGSIRTREDANAFAYGACQRAVSTCEAHFNSDDCQRPLAAYRLGDPTYVPSPGALLYESAYSGASASVQSLLTEGTDPNWQNTQGWTALMIASAERHVDTVTALLTANADPNIRNSVGRTALMYASIYGQDAIVERLLAAGANPNIVPADQSGWTALIAASARGHAATVELLLRGGADPLIKAKKGENALDIAQREGNVVVVHILRAVSAVPR